MKIIFDSEEQKEKIFAVLSFDLCPDDVGYEPKQPCSERCVSECMRCWEESVESEVKPQ